jgi:putative SOS response-associated peptidase YedK
VWARVGGAKESIAILNPAASADVVMPHEWMPLIVERSSWNVWLDETPGFSIPRLQPAATGTLTCASSACG